jgi:uncharacterized protein
MPVQMKTPGVYIVEKNAFPPAVVAVETAVPAFVGYTEKAEFKGKKLHNIPFKVTSMTEFETAFGSAAPPHFKLAGPAQPTALPPPVSPLAVRTLKRFNRAGAKLADMEISKEEAAAINALLEMADDKSNPAIAKLPEAGVAAGAVSQAQFDALVALQKLAGAPRKQPARLAKKDVDLLIAAPSATDGKLNAAEKAALTEAVALITDAAEKTMLTEMAAGNAKLTEDQTAALGKLKAALSGPSAGGSGREWTVKLNSGEYKVVRTDPSEKQFLLWHAMRMFFDNGGGPCWIVSVGSYEDSIALGDEESGLKAGIAKLKDELEPTMLVIPDSVRLSQANSISLQQAMLMHCGEEMKNRFAILDIHDGDQALQGDDPVAAFRNSLGVNNLDFGAAYYPWLNTTVVQDRDISYRNFLDNADPVASADQLLQAIAPQGDGFSVAAWLGMDVDSLTVPNKKVSLETFLKTQIPADLWTKQTLTEEEIKQKARINQVNQLLAETVENFKPLRAEAIRQLNVLPPGSAMAGLYTFVDNSRGVWKAPANVSVNAAVSPTVPISNYLQQDLNVTPMGKSVNAIRSFIGEGVLVWGARTLDGNSKDWRYVNVRRTMIFLEESCRLAAKRMVFEPNVSSTWVTIKTMIESFLNSVWRQGGLAGTVPEDAYSVHVGLGDTMTADDILEGILRVTVLVAISRPAEFIEITFQQQLQKS